MRLALVVHPERKLAGDVARRLVAAAARHGIEVAAAPEDAAKIPGCISRPGNGAGGSDAIVAVGGDGTVLEAVRLGMQADLPIFGVNAGHIGFLTQLEPGRLEDGIAALSTGEYTESRRMTLDAILPDGRTVSALNDVVVEKRLSQHVVKLAFSVGEESLLSYRADAVIVASPTGSTAYTFSAGGPLVDPELEALVVTPVAPHNLFGRPMVFRPTKQLRFDVVDDRPARVNVDGRAVADLEPGEGVTVVRGATAARFITFTPRNFAAAVRDKFHLHDA